MRSLASLVLLLALLTPALSPAQWQHKEGSLPSWGVLDALDASDSLNACASIRTGRRVFEGGGWDYNYPIAVTSDGGASWTLRFLPVDYGAVDVAMTDAKHIWFGTTTGRIYVSTDGGATWNLQYSDTSKTTFIDYIEMFNANEGVAVGDGDPQLKKPVVVLKTTNGGATWTSVAGSAFPGGLSGDVWRRIDFVSMNVGYFYVSGIGKFYKTTDGGATWNVVAFPSKVPQIVKFCDASIGLATTYVASGVPSIYRTTDGGQSWETFTVNDEQGWGNDIEFVPGDPAKVWYTSGKSMFFSSDTGRTWTKQLFDSADVHGRDIKLVEGGHGWFGCDQRAIYHTAQSAAVNENIQTGVRPRLMYVPSELVLGQNYPNPFNPSTSIDFALPRACDVSLKVFSVLGREVAALVAGHLEAGPHRVAWDASKMPSGVYLYRLEAAGQSETRRLLLLK